MYIHHKVSKWNHANTLQRKYHNDPSSILAHLQMHINAPVDKHSGVIHLKKVRDEKGHARDFHA